jgi:pyruvate dehydrogenase E2 component (dihydrolipoamide acetyltransferase)
MPALGAGMDVGKLLEWYVDPGDEVKRGQIIALVETDKANIDVEVFETGVIEELLVEPGTKVPVGAPMARIGAGAGAVLPVPAEVERVLQPEPLVREYVGEFLTTPRDVAGECGEEVDEAPFVLNPLVRRQARALGIDLRRIHGTGPGGVITRGDVAAAAVRGETAPGGGPAPRPAYLDPARAMRLAPSVTGIRSSPHARWLADEQGVGLGELDGTGPDGAIVLRDVPMQPVAPPTSEPGMPPAAHTTPAVGPLPTTGDAAGEVEDRGLAMRLAIARAMERSNREIPHYYLGETVDAEPMLRWLAEVNEELPPPDRLLPAAVVLKAVSLALVKYPDLNGYWIDGAFRPGEGIHLGVAINLRAGGLLAPAIRDVDKLAVPEVMAALKDLVERTRSGGLKGSELTDPTITVSNLGDTGVESIHGVITPPQVALVGVGRITDRPWAVDGMLTVHRTALLSLAGDHRASDGHRGGRFLAAIAKNLTRPEKL